MGSKATANSIAANRQNMLALPEGVELGNYRILRSLGQGGFGITYLAEVVSSGEKVVIKENLPTFCAWRDPATLQVSATNPNDELQEYPKLLTRFVEEAQLLARLDHPNIVKVLDAFEALGTAYYVMPWLGGKELHKAAPAPATITEAWLQPHLRTMLGALKYLHANNIYHRDVKPGNILLTEKGTPVLIDFGTARAIISERSATLVGSPGYSPIEQITVRGKRGPWTDIYSLGATCYRLITGEPPLEANERLVEETDPLRPLAHRAELIKRFRPAFLTTIDKALAIRGKDRWQSTDEWLAALPAPPVRTKTRTAQPVRQPTKLSVKNITASPLSVIEKPATSERPPKALIVGALIALVLALAVPGVYLLYEYTQESAMQEMHDELARQEAERQARKEAERKTKEDTERRAKENAEHKAKEDAERMARAREEARNKLKERGITEPHYYYQIINAAKNNDTELLTQFITAGANVNSTNNLSETPLLRAVMEGHAKCVKLLLAAPEIDVNKADMDGNTPLFRAAEKGQTECVRLLLAATDIDVNKQNIEGNTSLHSAAAEGQTECVKLLLAAPEIDVNKANSEGYIPLHRAAEKGQSECVKLLLAATGIDINKEAKNGDTPLNAATEQSHIECMKLLLAAPGIDVNQKAKYGNTPLYTAAEKGHTECVRLLLAVPAIDINETGPLGRTPLYGAAWKGHTECVRLLLAAPGIDVNKADKLNTTPLYESLNRRQTDCVRLLLAAPGIDVNKKTSDGWTPLHNAARGGHTEYVRLLLAAPGIDVNKETSDGWTPLHCAVGSGHDDTECVRLLLAAPGISVNKVDKKGKTPLYWAVYYGYTECAELIRAAGGR